MPLGEHEVLGPNTIHNKPALSLHSKNSLTGKHFIVNKYIFSIHNMALHANF